MSRCTPKYRRLAAEQAALRRLATLVAQGVEPLKVFGAVAEKCADVSCVHRRIVALRDGARNHDGGRGCRSRGAGKWPVGTRIPLEGNTIAAMVQRTGGPARMDSYDNIAGSTAARVRDGGCARGGGGAGHR